jgi:hypothetical protein
MSEAVPSSSEKRIYVSRTGLPLTFELKWPFHRSTSGGDFEVLHTDIRLENSDGLHAAVAVNLSQTVRDVIPSLEPKDVEGLVINALRKEVDHRQVEFKKSGKMVPVHFSSRHYDFKRNKWVFGKATDEEIDRLIQQKVFWQTRLVGGSVWLGEETEALYMETSLDHLIERAVELAKQGMFVLERRWATATEKLMNRAPEFEVAMQVGLEELEKKHAFERG